MPKVLNVKEGANIAPEVISAVASGYREDMILDELAQAVEDKIISRGQFESAIEALELYSARFTNSIDNISSAMKQFEFNDEQPILKNRRLDLAQQVMQDIDGFQNAVKEYDSEEDNELDETANLENVSKEEQPTIQENVEDKPSYQQYFMKKLDSFGVINPKDLSPEQWEEIDKGWKTKEEVAR